MVLVGWAADGYPVYARYCYSSASDATSALKVCTGSYKLVSTPASGRPSTSWAPLGWFTQDWTYSSGSGDLDDCNGRTGVTPEFPNGIYYYMLAAIIVLVLTVIGLGRPASAHLLPAQNATMNLIGKRAYLVVSVPVSALTGVDDNADGLLSGAELDSHKAEIGRQVAARFQVSSPEGAAMTGFLWVVNPQTDAARPPPTPYVVVLSGVEFARPPTTVTVRTDLFRRAVGEGQMSLCARSVAQVEIGVLNRQSASHVFFRGPLSILLDVIRVGVEHILTGPDHLLFLLTVVVAGVSWRYWAGVITAFTVAHSITLSLAVFAVLAAPSSLLQPAIAARILLMGADNLIRKRAVGRERVLL
eukprot:gene29987-38645_t